jgi:hypothetical protein
MLKMKKLLVLITLMVAVFGFTAGAFCAVGDPICTNCKGALRNVDCPAATGQGGACAINGFDYDNNAANAVATHGYCAAIGGLEKYKAIFAICNCVNGAQFVAGKPIAVREEILVNGLTGERGAYWSGTGVPGTILWDDFATSTAACAAAAQARNFGAPVFFRGDGTTVVAAAALITDTTCAVPNAGRSTILTTPASLDVVIAGDGPYWWIDIPPVRIDPTVLKNGEIVSVKISIYDPTLPLPICPACMVTICDCTIDIAQVCCTAAAPTTVLTFPYFTSLTAGDYWNGISISNPTALASTCTLVAREKDGSVGTATVTVPANAMFSDILPNITWAGTGLGGSPCYITATCNYVGAFGFGMLANGHSDSMGYKVP